MTRSGKKFRQAEAVRIQAEKIANEIAKAEHEKAEIERKARLAKIQAGWFALTT